MICLYQLVQFFPSFQHAWDYKSTGTYLNYIYKELKTVLFTKNDALNKIKGLAFVIY